MMPSFFQVAILRRVHREAVEVVVGRGAEEVLPVHVEGVADPDDAPAVRVDGRAVGVLECNAGGKVARNGANRSRARGTGAPRGASDTASPVHSAGGRDAARANQPARATRSARVGNLSAASAGPALSDISAAVESCLRHIRSRTRIRNVGLPSRALGSSDRACATARAKATGRGHTTLPHGSAGRRCTATAAARPLRAATRADASLSLAAIRLGLANCGAGFGRTCQGEGAYDP